MEKQILKGIFAFYCIFILTASAVSQTTLIAPTGDGGFETGTTFATNGWTPVNNPPTQTNKWFCGTSATGYTGARCAYIGTAVGNNNYNIGITSVSHFYRDIIFPAGQPNITLTFNWKGYGEGGYDFIRVYLVSTATIPVAGTQLFTGQVGGNLNLSTTWQTGSITLPCTAAGTMQRLVFTWINDASIGTMPAGAIDNISLVSNTTASCNAAMGTGVINVASIPYNSGAGTTCGQGDNLTASNTTVCGSTSYLTGEDRVWIFTPSTSGAYSFVLSAPAASYTGLMLFQGCPLGICTGPSATCITYGQSFTGDKSFCALLTGGTTYYLVLDSWATPTCNSYNNLSITSVTGASCTALIGSGLITVPSLPYNSGAGTTCGAGDNLTTTNMPVCGSAVYFTGEDQVFVFTPGSTGQVTIALNAPSASYTGLMLYAGCPVGSCGPGAGTCVAFAQDYTGSKSFCANVTAGITYYLVLDSYAFPTCNGYTALTISAVTTGTIGTTCANAVSIPALPYSAASQTTTCKGNDYTAATPGICNGTFAFGEDLVYAFTVTTGQCVGVSITGATNNDIGFAIYQGGCPGAGGTCMGGIGGATLGSLSGSVILPGAGTYYLVVDTRSPSGSVTFNIALSSFGSGAPNDMPFQATPLPFNIPIAGNNSCSGGIDEPAIQPSCFAPAGSNVMNTVWYSFIAPASGCVRVRTSLGTLTNTQIAAYGPVAGPIPAGSGSTLSPLNCSQDMPPCGFNSYPASQFTLTSLSPTSTYYIMVDGYSDMTGSFTIYIMDAGVGCNAPMPATPGQDCDLSFPVCKSNINVSNPGPQAIGSNCEFTSGVNCLASGERGSYWYRIRIVANGFLEFDIVPNDWAGAPSTAATDYDFAVWRTTTAGTPGPATCTNLATVPPVSCNYSALGVTGCFSAVTGNSPVAYPGFGGAYQPRIAVTAGDEYLLNVSNFSNSTSGFALNFSAGSPIATSPASGGTLVWTGSLNNDWYNPENWGGCVAPNCVLNVSIPSTPVNQPAVTGLTAVCGNLDITIGATLTLQANSLLKICNNFINNGTLTALANSTLIMQSDSVVQNQSMTGVMTGTSRLWNLIINKPSTAGGNTVTLNNNLDNGGSFTVGTAVPWTGGTFNATGRHHKVVGNFSVYYAAAPYSNYTATGGILEFNGAAAQSYFNRGSVNNVILNHTGPGVTIGNSGVTDWMAITGTLTLTQGKILTNGNRVHILNTLPAASGTGNNSSYIEGNLKRNFANTGGSYDFPVGTALKGYQRINFNFGISNDRTDAEVSFNNTALAIPTPVLGPECLTALYDQTPLNNGYWNVVPTPATGMAAYSVTAFNNNFTNPQSGYTIMSRFNAGTWALNGTCVPAAVITALQRNGFSAMGNPSHFATAQSLVPLPVELIYFDAKPKEKSIHLDWVTSSEISNNGFEIWKSAAPPDFHFIGWKDGNGTTTNLSEYHFEDFEVNHHTTYYYKLKQVDYDGHFKYSDLVQARLSASGHFITAAPNPYFESTDISIFLNYSAHVNIMIYSSVGQEVAELENTHLHDGYHLYNFSGGKLGFGKGVYTARVEIDGETSYIRLLELD